LSTRARHGTVRAKLEEGLMKRWTVIAGTVSALAFAAYALPAKTDARASDAGTSTGPVVTDVGPYVAPRSAVHQLQSAVVDDVYELRVSTPEDYGNDDGMRPVIYVLDGQWNFILMSDIVGKLSFDGLIPDPIVVAITWAGAGDQPAPERNRDFTPVADPARPGSGGAAQFLKVLETEVFPFVESRYRASTERVLTGGSLGGLFVGYALLERPDLFRGYVSSSGAFGVGQAYFDTRLAELEPGALSEEHAYFSVGAQYDNEPDVSAFFANLEAAAGRSPNQVLNVVPGVGHTGNEPIGYTFGLIHAFQRPRLDLGESFLERYEGAYTNPELPDWPDLIVQAGPGALYLEEDGVPWEVTFFAASPEHFYAQGLDLDLTFYIDEAGQQAFTLNYFRAPEQWHRR
jgi:predicted alpha/beta superfamily hydrolase